ncbi:hypothetical protein D9M72_505350 [compost metagenome]
MAPQGRTDFADARSEPLPGFVAQGCSRRIDLLDKFPQMAPVQTTGNHLRNAGHHLLDAVKPVLGSVLAFGVDDQWRRRPARDANIHGRLPNPP